MKRQIWKSLVALVAGVMTLCAVSSLFVSCTDLSVDIENLQDQINDIDERLKAVEELEGKLAALTARVDALYTLKFQTNADNELQYSFDGGNTWTSTGVILATQTDLKFRVADNNELEYSEDGGNTWKKSGVVLAENCDNVFDFKVENSKVYFSSDGGKTWKETGAVIVDPCTCPEAKLVDNGDSVTITIGDASFTIEKPLEVVFEIKAGKLYFASEATQVVTVKATGIDDLTVIAAPKGWEAEINSDGKIEVTAPSTDDIPVYDWWGDLVQEGNADASGFVKVHACSADGKCMVGKLAVEVSDTQIIVKAYGGNYEVANTDEWGMPVYYGVSLKENYLADAQALIDSWANNTEFAYEWKYIAEPAASGKLSEILGAEPEVGKEYVVWAMFGYDGWELPKIENLVLAYYSPVNVAAVEDEAKRTAYDNYITLTVQGAESYYALAVPANAGMDAESCKTMMVEDLIYTGSSMGKLYKDNYEGSFYQITSGTSSYIGEGTPGQTGTLLVLPIDGRPVDQYTVEDVKEFTFTTNELLPGGAVNVVVEQSFVGEKYNNETWKYEMMPLDPYSELGAKVTVPESGWKYFYFAWMTEDEYAAALNGDSEMIVDFVLNNPASYPIAPSELDPNIVRVGLQPEQTMHFVAFVVDETGKYGDVAKLKLTTDTLEKSDIMATAVTNLVDEVLLKNTQTLEVTLTADMEVSKYKYIWTETRYYHTYEGKTDAEMSDIIFFAEISNYGGAQEVLASDLVDGKLVIDGHSYNSPYYLAILPYDKDGNPGRSAIMIEYECVFELPSVITNPEAFKQTPNVKFEIPQLVNSEDRYDTDYNYSMMLSEWGTYCYYNLAYTVEAEEGLEVLSLFATEDDVKGMTAEQRAAGLWAGTLNYNINGGAGSFDKTLSGEPLPLAAYVLLTWKDAEGNYYYNEVDLSAQFVEMFKNLVFAAETSADVTFTPVGKQWGFTTTPENVFLPAGLNAVIDFGVTAPGSLIIAAEAGGQYVDAMNGMPLTAEVKPVAETFGVVSISGLQGFDDDDNPIFGEIDKACYYGLTEDTCSFISNMFGHVKGAKATTVTIQAGGIGGGPLKN